jgi:hypothetical protein
MIFAPERIEASEFLPSFCSRFEFGASELSSLCRLLGRPLLGPPGSAATGGQADIKRMRQWKIALSLAIVGALAAPFVFRTYKAPMEDIILVPLTAQQKEELQAGLENLLNDPNCWETTSELHRRTELQLCAAQNDPGCKKTIGPRCYDAEAALKKRLSPHIEYRPNYLEYFVPNAIVAVETFVGVFGLAYLIPMLLRGLASLARRYWKWLNA